MKNVEKWAFDNLSDDCFACDSRHFLGVVVDCLDGDHFIPRAALDFVDFNKFTKPCNLHAKFFHRTILVFGMP